MEIDSVNRKSFLNYEKTKKYGTMKDLDLKWRNHLETLTYGHICEKSFKN